MQGFDLKYALAKLLKMVTSRAWLTLLFAALAVSGIDVPAEWQVIIIATLATVYAGIVYNEGKNADPVG
jgi:hypothetical protein